MQWIKWYFFANGLPLGTNAICPVSVVANKNGLMVLWMDFLAAICPNLGCKIGHSLETMALNCSNCTCPGILYLNDWIRVRLALVVFHMHIYVNRFETIGKGRCGLPLYRTICCSVKQMNWGREERCMDMGHKTHAIGRWVARNVMVHNAQKHGAI